MSIETLARAAGVLEVAISDVVARRNVADVAMADDVFIEGLRTAAPHLFKPAEVDLVALAFGDRPNLTLQGRLLRERGKEVVEQLAADWGTTLGSLKPGRDPKAAKDDDRQDTTNPWATNFKGGDAEKKKASIIRSMGTKRAAQLAAAAGVTITGQPLRK